MLLLMTLLALLLLMLSTIYLILSYYKLKHIVHQLDVLLAERKEV